MSRITNEELEDLSCQILSIYGVDLYAIKRLGGWAVCKRLPGSSAGSDLAAGLTKREVYFYFSGLVIAADMQRIKQRDENIWMRNTAESMARDLIKS